MEQNQPVQQADPVQQKVNNAVALISSQAAISYQQMQLSSTRAVMALTQVKVIASAEQDEAANKLLVKVRDTFAKVEGLRKSITAPLDEIKALLMEPEKKISTDPKAVNEYNRVKKLRDQWANAQAAAAAAETARLEKIRQTGEAVINMNADIDKAIFAGIQAQVIGYNNYLLELLNKTTLQNYDAQLVIMQKQVQLNPAVVRGWFNVVVNTTLIDTAKYNEIINAALVRIPFTKIASDFAAGAQPLQQQFIAQMPGKKAQLQQVAEFADRNAEAARQLAEQQKNEAEALAQKNAEAMAAQQQQATALKTDEIQAQADDQRLNNNFENQIATQSIAAPTIAGGTRKVRIATLVAPEEEVPPVLAELIYQCLLHPKFKLIKENKAGEKQFDENGRPVYAQWLEELLSFFAENVGAVLPGEGATINGIEIKEAIKTIQKAAKA